MYEFIYEYVPQKTSRDAKGPCYWQSCIYSTYSQFILNKEHSIRKTKILGKEEESIKNDLFQHQLQAWRIERNKL